MMSTFLCGVSAAAITAQLTSTPLTWTDLFTSGLNNTNALTSGRTYMMRYTGVRPAPFTNVRMTFSCTSGATLTVSKVYIGEVASDRSGYFFQSAPTQVFFDGGSASFSLSGVSSKLSDEIDFDFSGARALGIALYLSARSGSVPRLINGTTARTYYVAGDSASDPTNAATVEPSTNLILLSDVDVVLGIDLVVNKILASRQAVSIVKEGSAPSQADYIRTTNQVLYVVKS